MAEHIKSMILANPDLFATSSRDPDTNTYCLAGQHITSAALLPFGHPVRKLLAASAVEGYIRRDNHKLSEEIRESPDFAVDLLLQIKETLKTVKSTKAAGLTFHDLFSILCHLPRNVTSTHSNLLISISSPCIFSILLLLNLDFVLGLYCTKFNCYI